MAHNPSLAAMHVLVDGIVGVEDLGKVGMGSVTVALLEIFALAIDP